MAADVCRIDRLPAQENGKESKSLKPAISCDHCKHARPAVVASFEKNTFEDNRYPGWSH